jgi:hypothetical protein
MTGTSFLDAFKTAADDAEVAEATFRREIAGRIKALERERAFAFRRLNFMQHSRLGLPPKPTRIAPAR